MGQGPTRCGFGVINFFSVTVFFSVSLKMLSGKRKCGFLETRVAKKLKLPKELEIRVNSFLMKPRNYYSYIRGAKPRFEAYNLCLAAIDNAGSQTENDVLGDRTGSDQNVFWIVVYELAMDFLRWNTYGIQLSRDFKTISQKENVLGEIRNHFDSRFRDNFNVSNRLREYLEHKRLDKMYKRYCC